MTSPNPMALEAKALLSELEDAQSRLYDLAQQGEKWGYQDRHNDAHKMAGVIGRAIDALTLPPPAAGEGLEPVAHNPRLAEVCREMAKDLGEMLTGAHINETAAARAAQFIYNCAVTGGLAWEAPPPATPAARAAVLEPSALTDVAAERERQKSVEGWTAKHDDGHMDGQLALAAACYAAPVPIHCEWQMPDGARSAGEGSSAFPPSEWRSAWPWDAKWWKPTDRRRDLVKAGALILAEIERLDRAALKEKT